MPSLAKTLALALTALSVASAFQSPLGLRTQHDCFVGRKQRFVSTSIGTGTGTGCRLPLVLSAEEKSSKTSSSTLEEQGVVELPTGTGEDPLQQQQKVVPTFLSQGEIDPETLSPDLSDPKQARVIIYIVLSLIPVLFLIPFMLGSRDLIPLEALPPVDI